MKNINWPPQRHNKQYFTMQCPQCAANSIIIKDGTKICTAKKCTYEEFHIISYQNEVRNFEDHQVEGRCQLLASSLALANSAEENKIYGNYMRCQKELKTLAEVMDLPFSFVRDAQKKLFLILRQKYQAKTLMQNKISITDHLIMGYSLYCACYEKGLFYKDVRIANELQCRKREWEVMVSKLNLRMHEYMTVPKLRIEQQVLRVPVKRKINAVEKNAMAQMARRIRIKNLEDGTKLVTISAYVFWQIMKRSLTYNKVKEFSIKKYLKTITEEEEYWTQTHFDVNLSTLKSFDKKKIGEELMDLIPDFETRMDEFLVNKKI